MNTEFNYKLNQQKFLLQKIINKINSMQKTIDNLEKKINNNEDSDNCHNETNYEFSEIISILDNYDSRIEELERKIA